MSRVEELLDEIGSGLADRRCFRRYQRHILSQLVCLGRHTLSGLISTSGYYNVDWSSDYKLYQRDRAYNDALFRKVLETINSNAKNEPLVLALDDTFLPKVGKKIPKVGYIRDPMGPHFCVNFIRAQRFVQISAAIAQKDGGARMIPVAFEHAPWVPKPGKRATDQQWKDYRKAKRTQNLSIFGAQCIDKIRTEVLHSTDGKRPLWLTVDGGYTNKNVFQHLPSDVTMIGRIRCDAKMNYQPLTLSKSVGRRRDYGPIAPTPEQIRKDETIPWQTVKAFATGRMHDFKVKTISGLQWRVAGKEFTFRLVVIAPLGYRLSKNGYLNFRNPAYLICTDPTIPLEKLLQAYLWRWDIEVNFRDEKTLLGVGQAQVRNTSSITNVPQMMVAAYACLLVAAENLNKNRGVFRWRPKWYPAKQDQRLTTSDHLRQIRVELWTKGIDNCNFSGFASLDTRETKPQKYDFSVKSAVMSATM